MAYYSQDVLEEVRAGNDIVEVVSQYVPLKQKGKDYFGLCPFHRENSPSFSVSADKQMYYCFGCGAGGNVIGFVMQIENHNFVDSVRFLADRIHYALPEGNLTPDYKRNLDTRNTIYEIHVKTARFFYDNLMSDKGASTVEYLETRKISVGARKKFGLGFASEKRNGIFQFLMEEGYDIDVIVKSGLVIQSRSGDYFDRFTNRLMFPIFDVQNRIVGFGGRIMGQGEPKYLNSPDSPIFDKSRNLYGINFARQEKKEELIVVEGYMDVISLYQAGFRNVVASLGTAFNGEHVRLLKKYCSSVILLFDSDEAGEKAVLRAIPVLKAGGIQAKVLQLKDAKDPDDFIKSQGNKAFAEALDRALPYPMFQVACIKKKFNLKDTSERLSFTKEASVVVANLDNAIERDVYTKEIAKSSGVAEGAIQEEVKKMVDKGVDSLLTPTYRNKPAVMTNAIATKGVDEAKRNVLYVASSRQDLCLKMAKVLEPSEFGVPTYNRLFEVFVEKHQKGENVYIADVMSLFEELEEQQTITAIFAVKFEYETEEALVRALNDQVRLVKTAYIDELLSQATEIEDIQKLVMVKKSLQASYIAMD